MSYIDLNKTDKQNIIDKIEIAEHNGAMAKAIEVAINLVETNKFSDAEVADLVGLTVKDIEAIKL